MAMRRERDAEGGKGEEQGSRGKDRKGARVWGDLQNQEGQDAPGRSGS